MKGLCDVLTEEYSNLNRKIYNKASLVAISHALEDTVLRFKLNSEIFAAFQDFKFFMQEFKRYQRLDKQCRKIYIFAQNIDPNITKVFKNTVFINIPSWSALSQEWFVVINHPRHPMVFSCKEEYGLQFFDEDEFRMFSGFLSFSPEIITRALEHFKKILYEHGIDYTPSSTKFDLAPGIKELNQKVYFFLNQALDELEHKNYELKRNYIKLQRAFKENKLQMLEMLKRLCYAAEFKDENTALHLIRISFYSTKLYSKIEKDPKKIEQMYYASLMHDIGKIGIPDTILTKPMSLTPSEFNTIKKHTIIGANILKGSSKPLIQMAKDIALYHHEKWDGTGYPTGKKGFDIPLHARVVAIADVFDALSTKRVYKPPYSIDKCIKIINENKNKHFQGDLVELFLENIKEFIAFKNRLESLLKHTSESNLFDYYFNEPFIKNKILAVN